MTDAIELKAGNVFQKDGKLIKVLETNHHKPGKGNTVMQMKLNDVRSGSIVQTTMRPTEKVELAEMDHKNAQYLYSQDDTAYFMDTDTYDQYELPLSHISEEVKYLVPNMQVQLEFFEGELISLDLPTTVDLKVTETTPSIKGATAASGGKPATMETGLVVQVPDFIQTGEVLTINTTNGAYKSRAQN
ncbi:elongation factor P [Schleiferilactobacillus harbinensis]|jgi:elongation factor P|uniref:Elongation factor P n=2 Tax=Schleiferilactobacillus harbinensis TaxID=304207 RepID=A0A510TXG1_9LACO|nr:elongation factor P [Schleiferilactobacillus harbinensis]KRM29708.1 protein translation elongation factor P [Schleiferilactobacillus harbinensis DSM 16991]MBO3092462.1 elongation factor P [Schleiferilactobacillus harbinensis]MCI1686464.1 elongation factor P [Schleiferilactobacillus harbinensis]MCI1782919.1 elongation factor P [Schleiferilactobacillus harbinensis]MCI1850850.1 elongation factor P [Schleiferilactobacillus harbinensis]